MTGQVREPATTRGVRQLFAPDPPGGGRVVRAAGSVVRASGIAPAIGEVVLVGPPGLLGEVIRLEGGLVTIQVYEETAGLRIGDPVVATGRPLVAWLGLGLLGAVLDGLQRPLDRLAAAGEIRLTTGGLSGATGGSPSPVGVGHPATAVPDLDRPVGLDPGRRWPFVPIRRPGDRVSAGDVLGEVPEGPIRHRVLVPADLGAATVAELDAVEATVEQAVGWLELDEGRRVPVRLAHPWPVRRPRPVARRLPVERPLLTGQRVLDMLFPVAEGGAAVIPGGFGTGKTVVEQSLARWSDADVVVYVGCGERGNEMAELLGTFPDLVDPRTGGSLLARTVLIANTSNMPVAAREASVQLGMTIAEYFRDQGLRVALLADSTSRWAEALREIGGRLEELPGEEGYPAYLASRLAAFYERAGRAVAIGDPERTGSITLVAAVSPPGGDFSEPVTQASLRLGGTFWALDTELAHARHFPAIGWTQSYSLSLEALEPWYATNVDPTGRRCARLRSAPRPERALLDVVALVGADAIPDSDRAVLESRGSSARVPCSSTRSTPGRIRPPDVQVALLRVVLAAGTGLSHALDAGATLEAALAAPVLEEIARAKSWTGENLITRLDDLARRVAALEAPAGAEAAR
jgi:V/A-type H+-transporting ATPase subunit A